MGHKVHPKIYRIGKIYSWNSKWFADKKDYRQWLQEDVLLRGFLFKKFRDAGIDSVEIERPRGALTLTIHVSRPGMIIGRGGTGIEELRKELQKKFKWLKERGSLNMNILEVAKPGLSAEVVLQGIIADIEKRVSCRRAAKQALARIMKAGALGARIIISGRIDGAEIARTNTFGWGKIPLHTLRADISFGQNFAQTTYGTIGVKVWIYRGEIFKKTQKSS